MLNYFPTFSNYNFGFTGGTKAIKNIFKSVNIQVDDVERIEIEKIYPGERPEQLSYRLYTDFNYYWLLMLLNGVKNPFQWNKILGQNVNTSELDKYDARVLQFSNSSPFLPGVTASGVTYNGIKYNLYSTTDNDSYSGIDFSGIQPGDTVIFKKGLTDYSINCVGAGLLETPTQIQNFYNSGLINDWYQYGQSLVPTNLNNQKNIVQLTAGDKISCCMDDRGYIYCWGDYNILDSFGFNKDGRLYTSPNGGYTFIEASNDKLVAIKQDYKLQFFGPDILSETSLYAGQTGSKTSWFHVTDTGSTGGVLVTKNGTVVDIGGTLPPTGTTLSDVACGSQFCIGLLGNGGLTGWGANNYQQLSGIPGGTGFIKISATYNHAMALKNDGTVYAWGLSADGQCSVPSKKFSDISAGKKHSAALTQNNELCAWGKITKAGFTGPYLTGITVSNVTLSQYTIYGNYDKIYSGDNHIVLKGMTGTEKTFVGIIDVVDNEYKRLICKSFSGNLTEDELFFTDPTGTVVAIIKSDGTEIIISDKLVGIQRYKNSTISIISGNQTITVTPDVWKTVYMVNYNTPEKDQRLQTLQKSYDLYNSLSKEDVTYVSRDLAQIIRDKIQRDLDGGASDLNYNISSF